jgi:hypothetical protein
LQKIVFAIAGAAFVIAGALVSEHAAIVSIVAPAAATASVSTLMRFDILLLPF